MIPEYCENVELIFAKIKAKWNSQHFLKFPQYTLGKQ